MGVEGLKPELIEYMREGPPRVYDVTISAFIRDDITTFTKKYLRVTV